MIDYEKLKEEIDVIHKRMYVQKDEQLNEDARALCVSVCHSLESIYVCLNKLKELTAPKPKYQLGEIVWLFNYECNEIDCFKIDAISTKTLRYSGECCNSDFVYEEIPEKDLYPSREALIDAQIEYWKGLKQEHVVPVDEMHSNFEGEIKGFRCFDEPKECEHEGESISSWGIIKSCKGDINKPYQCKKCGEFR
ncbi:hypothetical protein OQJ16_07580 [Legionella pneumophila]|uniref:hypothetical protein n=1 Tax=Legionella pneumophila TaxID=446 RepID=UPI002243E2CE|nr:hypothetical protein [Legionella pneumophila]MCW8457423.1 hypothetical protein [Legionella pneumophila]